MNKKVLADSLRIALNIPTIHSFVHIFEIINEVNMHFLEINIYLLLHFFDKNGKIILVINVKRKITKVLEKWKDSSVNKAFLLLGARQVGKTYIIRQFAADKYNTLLEINFEIDLNARKIFDTATDYYDLMLKLSSYALTKGIKNIYRNEALIFLDEIQACPKAITMLKFLVENGELDVVASGSLLGVTLNKVSSYPVGYVQEETLYPMDFEEFLVATGLKPEIINQVNKGFINSSLIDQYYHDLLIQLLTKYVVVGGMPAAVLKFIEKNDMAEVYTEQKNILLAYRKDIEKYVEQNDLKIKVLSCFDSIPEQLAKENKKFQYKLIRQGGNARYFESSIDWIVSSGLAHKCYRLDSIQSPIKYGKNLSSFKLYLNDVGLLVAMYGPSFQSQILNGDLGIIKGAIYEQLIAQMLLANNHELFYFIENSSLEIDFIIENMLGAIPLEVKSGNNTKSQSLKSFITKNKPKMAIKLSMNNVNCTNEIIKCYPLYMVIFIK